MSWTLVVPLFARLKIYLSSPQLLSDLLLIRTRNYLLKHADESKISFQHEDLLEHYCVSRVGNVRSGFYSSYPFPASRPRLDFRAQRMVLHFYRMGLPGIVYSVLLPKSAQLFCGLRDAADDGLFRCDAAGVVGFRGLQPQRRERELAAGRGLDLFDPQYDYHTGSDESGAGGRMCREDAEVHTLPESSSRKFWDFSAPRKFIKKVRVGGGTVCSSCWSSPSCHMARVTAKNTTLIRTAMSRSERSSMINFLHQ